MAAKRNWYVAVGDVGGEYSGNPLSFDASAVYGPYTETQAMELEKLGEKFESETYRVVTFQLTRFSFRQLKVRIHALLTKSSEKEDGLASDNETTETHHD